VDIASHWSADPAKLLPVALAAFLYWRRALTLRRRGTPVPAWRQGLFGFGLLVFLLAVVSPLDWLGEERLFAFHMLQHVLLGDIAALCIVAGLTGPLLRPILQLGAVERLRFLAHPLVALPLWTANLFAWHLPGAYEAALGSDAVHALQHLCFFTFGALMWAPVVEVLPGPMWFGTGWKLGYIVVVRLLETVLGNVFLWAGTVVYATYEDAPRLWGLSPLADQGIAGGVMMIEGSLVTIGALAWLFLRLGAEGELRQQLLERGLDPRAVNRAVRYGRAEELRR
jgi:cytochrome c oxidase assembly factor CtaG